MKPSISQLATDPSQYDKDELIWNEEGKGLSPIRRVFLEKLSPHLENLYDKTALELGCGQGWLCQEMQKRGAEIIGIDPSRKTSRPPPSNTRI